jgi:hypothetical protein
MKNPRQADNRGNDVRTLRTRGNEGVDLKKHGDGAGPLLATSLASMRGGAGGGTQQPWCQGISFGALFTAG